MELFFSDQKININDEQILSKEESRHIGKVLRKKRGDSILVTDGAGCRATALIDKFDNQLVQIKISEIQKVPFSPANKIHVAISIIRPNRLDWAIEKLTELGVEKITPLICQFTSSKSFKSGHLKKIAVSALKQSGQFYLPQISQPVIFRQFMANVRLSRDYKFIADQKGVMPSASSFSEKASGIKLVIGPEGGFNAGELECAAEAGFQKIQLGENILRTETAAVTAVAQLKLLMQNREHISNE